MICKRCKNPVDDNATTCEWCGASIEKPKPVQQPGQPQFSELDTEIMALLRQGQKPAALALCKQKTGMSSNDSRYYVARLNFFLQNENATEILWQDYYRKTNKSGCGCSTKLVSWVVLPFVIFMIIVSMVMIASDEPAKEGSMSDSEAGVICLIFFSVIALFILLWLYISKRKLL